MSDVVVSNTKAPQGPVLFPFLFTLYTSDIEYISDSCHLQRYSDDIAVVGCVRGGHESEHRELVKNFVRQKSPAPECQQDKRHSEMAVDSRRGKNCS